MAKLPNIYSFATSELSQDASLAYILAWADPQYSANGALHELGMDMLRTMLIAASVNQNYFELKEFQSVKVGTQRNNIDVWVEVNDDTFLIIEDKTNTSEHSDQISRYQEIARQYKNDFGEAWKHILPLYVKTGNESIQRAPNKCGCFYRHDLLKVLRKHTETGNDIINEFTSHLERWESETLSYLSTPLSAWPWSAQQGFYTDLEQRMLERHERLGFHGESDLGWDYVSNRSGGFLGLWWYWQACEGESCHLYLQLSGPNCLQIRVSSVKDENGDPTRTSAPLLHRVFRRVLEQGQSKEFPDLRVEKSGRFKSGWYSGVANIKFDDSGDWRPCDRGGSLRMDEAMLRLEKAMAFVSRVGSLPNNREV